MSDPISAYFDHAQLSMAAYADLTPDMTNDEYKTALRNGGFSDAQATAFISTYSVVSVFNDPDTDFSATLFQKNGSPEKILAIRGTESWRDLLISDLQIGVFGLTNQYASLENFSAQIMAQLQPADTLTVTGHSLGGFLAQAFTLDHQTFVDHTYTYNSPGLGGVLINPVGQLGITANPVPNGLITNLIAQGHSFASSTGAQFGTPRDIFIETSINPPDNHGKGSITDSLALYDLFGRVDPSLSQNVSTITEILEAASSDSTNSLEKGLDALRRLFGALAITETPLSPPGVDPSSAARNSYYTNLIALRGSLPSGSFEVRSLVGQPASTIVSQAQTDIAYRYALKELNPFVILGVDYQALHNADGALELYNAQIGQGTWTALALEDRAELLASKNQVYVNDGALFSGLSADTHFADTRTGFESGTILATANDVIFGDDRVGDVINGRGGDDHLYGGDGADTIEGNGGRDYIEGNAGNDPLLSGGAGNDIILGQQGDDRLDGGADNDRLNGGLGDDRLEGGGGVDQYTYFSGQGQDRIADSDRFGSVIFDGQVLRGGLRLAGDPTDTYIGSDGRFTYLRIGNDLIVNNAVTIENFDFANGMLGIDLVDGAGAPTGQPPTVSYDRTISGTADAEFLNDGLTNLSNDQLFGGDGRDIIEAGGGADALCGGDGDDLLIDFLYGDGEDDYLDGGTGHDYVLGGVGNDIVLGGEGNDFLFGSSYGSQPDANGLDYLDGGSGNDYLWGGAAADTLLGGADQDILRGDNLPGDVPTAVFTEGGGYVLNPPPSPFAVVMNATGGADFLDGGAGDDLLQGDAGDDVLIGGSGSDRLYGDNQDEFMISEGDDWLDGGDGNDQLFAAGGNDSLNGGAGIDQLYGDQGDDILEGGAGADTIVGGDGADVLFGGADNDLLFGEGLNNPFEASSAGAADFLDGGEGDDELQGGVGDDSLFGGSGADLLFGQEGNDSLLGDEGNDELQGGIGEDVLYGDAGNDSLFGQDGNDSLSGDAGDDLLNGGLGNDQLDGGEGIDDVQGREGDDVLDGGKGGDFLYGDGDDPTVLSLIGGDDTLDGEEGDDQLWGGAGQDQLFGGDGADQLVGDVGDDQIYGEGGNDSLFGDSPFFPSEAGTDLLDGGDGNDLLQGGGGDDQLEGGSGDDVLVGEFGDIPGAIAGNDDLHGGVGNDRLIGGAGSDTYHFDIGDGLDSIEGESGSNNRLVFGAGITADSLSLDVVAGDSLVLRVGTNGDAIQIVGFGVSLPPDGHSIDRFEFADGSLLTDRQLLERGFHLSAAVNGGTLLGTTFADQMQGSQANDLFYGREGNDVLNGDGGADELRGDDGDDVLDGGAGNDRLYGGLGDNVLRGGEGNDLLESVGAGDQLLGGAGNDIYRLWSVLPTIVEEMNAGIDTIHLAPTSSFTFQTPDHVENVQIQDDFYLGSTVQVNLVGNTLDNDLSGSHRLDGREGNDTLVGIGDNTFVFDRGYGQDTIRTGMQVYARTGFDEVQFLSGIAVADLAVENHANDLVLKINGTTDQLTVESYFDFPTVTLDQFVFTDGTVWTADDINNRVQVFVGSEADDSFYGSLGDDTIQGLGGNDQIRASTGNDILDGGIGNDFLEGHLGDDIYLFGRGYGYDSIDEQGDNDDVDTLRLMDGLNPGDIVLQATPDNSTTVTLTVNGTNDQLSLDGFFMDQASRIDRIEFADGTIWDYNAMLARVEGVTMTGTEESDYLYANVTNDILLGLGGEDSLYGLAGNDTLSGGAGRDELNGGAGSDTLDGGLDADTMIGGSGNDLYMVDDVADTVTEQAGQGADTVHSTITYTLGANVEHLTLTGGSVINGIGNAGSNILTGNSAANVLTGGTGNDTYVVGVGDTVVEQASSGTDTVQSSFSWTLESNVENLTLTGGQAIDGTGNPLSNLILGNNAANLLNGMQGADRLAGGQGDDTYVVDSTGDIITENVNEGLDTVLSSISYTLGANVEKLTLTGTGAVNGAGNALNNVLVGNSAANRLTGGAGDDTYVIATGDTVVESSGGGTDTAQSSVTHTLAANVENLTLTGTAAINGKGNSLNNVLTGNSAANTLTGGAGNDTLNGGGGVDTLVGGLGNDTYVRDNAGDVVTENANEGSDTVQSSVTYTLGTNLEHLTLTGTASINGTGNGSNNVMQGNNANNTLSGLGGDDTYLYSRGGGHDIVTDNSGTADRLLFGADMNPLDLVISRQANDLRLAVHGTADQVTVQNWYGGAGNQTEFIEAGNGQELANSKVEQLLQAMAAFTQQTGLTWDQGIDQRPQDVQTILAASWQ